LNKRLDREGFKILRDRWIDDLPGNTRQDVMTSSLLHLANQPFTPQLMHETAWRLAGNVHRLKAREPVPPWNRQTEDEYAPVQIMSVERVYTEKQASVEVALRILAGPACPLLLHKIWSFRFCGAMSRFFGFSRSHGQFPYSNPAELVNMRFYVLLEKRLCGVALEFDRLWMNDAGDEIRPGACRTYNREWIKRRNRDPAWHVCPRNYSDTLPCYACTAGQDECLAAVRPRSYVPQLCGVCEREQWFDPSYPDRVECVTCHQRIMEAKSR